MSPELRSISRLRCANNPNKGKMPDGAILLNNVPMKAYMILVDVFTEANKVTGTDGKKVYEKLVNKLVGSIDDEFITEEALTYFAQIAFWVLDVKTVDEYLKRSPVRLDYVWEDFGWSTYYSSNINDAIIELMLMLRDCYIIPTEKGFTAYSNMCTNFSNPLFSMSCNHETVDNIKIPSFIKEG